MPTYEYECTCCASRFERRRSFTEDAAVPCPQCGGKTQRLFSPVPIIFKGSGFYTTDSRSYDPYSYKEKEAERKSAKASDTDKDAPSSAKVSDTDEAS